MHYHSFIFIFYSSDLEHTLLSGFLSACPQEPCLIFHQWDAPKSFMLQFFFLITLASGMHKPTTRLDLIPDKTAVANKVHIVHSECEVRGVYPTMCSPQACHCESSLPERRHNDSICHRWMKNECWRRRSSKEKGAESCDDEWNAERETEKPVLLKGQIKWQTFITFHKHTYDRWKSLLYRPTVLLETLYTEIK